MIDEAAFISEVCRIPYEQACRINAGIDILMDKGISLDDATVLTVTAESQGKDAERMAREVVRRVATLLDL